MVPLTVCPALDNGRECDDSFESASSPWSLAVALGVDSFTGPVGRANPFETLLVGVVKTFELHCVDEVGSPPVED